MLLSLFYLLVRRALGTGRRPTDERDIDQMSARTAKTIRSQPVMSKRMRRSPVLEAWQPPECSSPWLRSLRGQGFIPLKRE